MHLKVRLETGETEGEIRRLRIERLDIGGRKNPAGLNRLGLAQEGSRFRILLAHQGDLCTTKQRIG
jgi:hypothetical protein